MPGEDNTPDNTFDLIYLQVLISFFGTVISCVNTSLVVFSLGMDLFAISTIDLIIFFLLFIIAVVASISSWLMYDYEDYVNNEFKRLLRLLVQFLEQNKHLQFICVIYSPFHVILQ